jgi:Restriction endonuclease
MGSLSDEDFERLVFSLISDVPGYENPEWLTRTNAPDRGRDLSVARIITDPLSGVMRSRVLIQCRNWLTKSVGPTDVATLKEQMTTWVPPKVDVLVIATSGRFTSDAVAIVEKHNGGDRALKIEMWPESHLERLLAVRPALIAEFGLR